MASRLRAGCGPADALAWVISAMDDHEITGRFNFLLTDGEVIAATAAGDTLCYRLFDGGVVVASEPWDDEPGWTEVSDRSVLEATAAGVDVRPLAAPHLIAQGPAEEGTITR